MEMKFFRCKLCNKVVAIVDGPSSCPTKCCGEKMEELIPNSQDGALEKHVPTYTIDNNIVNVTVGSIDHPMENKHYISWIVLITDKGNQRKILSPNDKPCAAFALLENEKVISVLAYCNVHGLYKA